MTKAKTGTPQFVVKVQPVGQYTGTQEMTPVDNGWERSIFMPITEKSMPYVAKKLTALGFSGGSLRKLDPATDGFEDFRGTAIDCICRHEADRETGEPRERWDIAWEREGSDIGGDPLEAGDYRALDALFGAAVKANGGGPKPAAKPKPTAAPTPVTDDDLPF
jgi:hypothetical protein